MRNEEWKTESKNYTRRSSIFATAFPNPSRGPLIAHFFLLLKKVCLFLNIYQGMISCFVWFQSWRDFIEHKKLVKRIAQKIIKRWASSYSSFAFDWWRIYVSKLKRKKRLMEKCIFKLKNKMLAMSADTWRENAVFLYRLRVFRDSTIKRNRAGTVTALKKCSLWQDVRRDRAEWKTRLDRVAPVPSHRNFDNDWAALVGNMAFLEPSAVSGVVRFFVSSTFDDTLHERNFILEDVIPYVKECARKRGLDLALSEMRFGIREKASSNNRTLEICLDELRNCQEVSAGLNFILISCDKYGFRACPYRIAQVEFDALIMHMGEEEAEIALRCYRLDENALESPEYVMRTQDEIAHFWKGTFQCLQCAFRGAAKRLWSEELQELNNPYRSVPLS